MDEEIWHLTPTNDIEEHVESSYCKCEPEVEVLENGDVLVIHNAFDGREAVELANEIING